MLNLNLLRKLAHTLYGADTRLLITIYNAQKLKTVLQFTKTLKKAFYKHQKVLSTHMLRGFSYNTNLLNILGEMSFKVCRFKFLSYFYMHTKCIPNLPELNCSPEFYLSNTKNNFWACARSILKDIEMDVPPIDR